jgi:DNA-binding NtrC family response regulator
VAVHSKRLCIVMACDNAAEAAEVGQQISQVNTGCLITYRKAEDVLLYSPSGKVALIILANLSDPSMLANTLRLIRRRWPHCPIVVIADAGGGAMERAAREGGASFLARPVAPEQWAAMVDHVLLLREGTVSEEQLG